MPTFTDALTGTPGALLSARTGWSRPTGSDSIPISSGGTGVDATNGTTAANGTWHVPTSQPSGNDEYASGILNNVAGSGVFPLGVRCNTASALGQGYLLRRTTNTLELFRRNNSGTLTSMGTFLSTAGNLANPVTLKAVGTSISVELLGSTVIGPVTDTNIASGSVAFLSRGGSAVAGPIVSAWDSGDVSTGITGTLSATLGALTAASVGALAIRASGANTLGAMAAAGAGKLAIAGTSSSTLGELTASAAGSLAIAGAASATLGAVTSSATGALAITGAVSATLGAVTLSATGLEPSDGLIVTPEHAFIASGRTRDFITGGRTVTFTASARIRDFTAGA